MITKFEKFTMRTLHRRELKNAPYNPRKINEKQRKGLKANLKRVGMITPIIWNENTGHIVGGHRRVEILDDLNKSDDYELTVAVVDLDEQTEKEQNIFLNSLTYQGEFDFDALAELLENGVDYKMAGLDEYDLNILGIELDTVLKPEPVEEENEVIDDLRHIKEIEKQAANIQSIKDRKAASREEIIDRHKEDGERYVTLSFSTYEAKCAFMLANGFNPDDLFLKGEIFAEIVRKNAQN